MARMKNLSRFKRTITIEPRTYANVKRVKIDPRTKYIRQTKAEVDVINRMLEALEEQGYSNTWASKTLFNKLDSTKINIVANGKIDKSKISKDYSMSSLVYIRKALNDFKASKTSTVKGVEARIDDERQFIAEQTDNEEFANSLSEEELGQIYSVFNDVDYKALTESGQYESDEIFSFIVEAKEQNYGVRKFMQTIRAYSEDYPDRDVRDSFKAIYKKYVTS